VINGAAPAEAPLLLLLLEEELLDDELEEDEDELELLLLDDELDDEEELELLLLLEEELEELLLEEVGSEIWSIFARSCPVVVNWMVLVELLPSVTVVVKSFHVVHEPVGGKVMGVVTPLTTKFPVRELVTPSA